MLRSSKRLSSSDKLFPKLVFVFRALPFDIASFGGGGTGGGESVGSLLVFVEPPMGMACKSARSASKKSIFSLNFAETSLVGLTSTMMGPQLERNIAVDNEYGKTQSRASVYPTQIDVFFFDKKRAKDKRPFGFDVTSNSRRFHVYTQTLMF